MAKTLWIDTILDLQVASGSVPIIASLMGDVDTTESRLTGMTLLRTIIGLHIAHLVHDSGEGSQKVSIGIAVAPQVAFVAGQGSLPNPGLGDDHPTRGWIFRAQYVTYGFAADQAAVFDNRIDKDIRSRRKLENGECYFTVNNGLDQGSAGTIGVIGLIRQLWLVT